MHILLRLALRITFIYLILDGISFESKGLALITKNSRVGKFMFLTIVSCAVAVLALALFQVKDLLGKRGASKLLFGLTRKIMAIAFALNNVVCVLFWPIFFYDDSLLAPKEVIKQNGGSLLPIDMNLKLHAAPALALWLEFLWLDSGKALKFTFWDHFAVFGAAAAYAIYIHVLYHLDGIWAYPLLAQVSFTQRMALVVASSITGSAFLILARLIRG